MIWRKLIPIVGILAVVAAGYLGFRHVLGVYTDTVARLGTLETALEVQDATIQAQEDAIREWEEARARLEKRLEELDNVSQEARAVTAAIRSDLSALDSLEGDALGDAANRVSRNTWCLFGDATGVRGLGCPAGNSPANSSGNSEARPDLPD